MASPARGGLALTLCLAIVAPYPVAAGPPASDWWSNRWLISDHLGSVVVVVTAGGEVVRRRSFEPFGEVLSEDGTEESRVIFAGHEYAEATQVYDFKARWYVPSVGRFASVDPVIFLSDPQQQNGFSYVRNNPIRHVDPTGMFLGDFGAIAIAIAFMGLTLCDGFCDFRGPPPDQTPQPPKNDGIQAPPLPELPASVPAVVVPPPGGGADKPTEEIDKKIREFELQLASMIQAYLLIPTMKLAPAYVTITGLTLIVGGIGIVLMGPTSLIYLGSAAVVGFSGVIATDLGFGLSNSTYGTGFPTSWDALPEMP